MKVHTKNPWGWRGTKFAINAVICWPIVPADADDCGAFSGMNE
jgi:hypothetical protein